VDRCDADLLTHPRESGRVRRRTRWLSLSSSLTEPVRAARVSIASRLYQAELQARMSVSPSLGKVLHTWADLWIFCQLVEPVRGRRSPLFPITACPVWRGAGTNGDTCSSKKGAGAGPPGAFVDRNHPRRCRAQVLRPSVLTVNICPAQRRTTPTATRAGQDEVETKNSGQTPLRWRLIHSSNSWARWCSPRARRLSARMLAERRVRG
jgi:hypothetical protein